MKYLQAVCSFNFVCRASKSVAPPLIFIQNFDFYFSSLLTAFLTARRSKTFPLLRESAVGITKLFSVILKVIFQ